MIHFCHCCEKETANLVEQTVDPAKRDPTTVWDAPSVPICPTCAPLTTKCRMGCGRWLTLGSINWRGVDGVCAHCCTLEMASPETQEGIRRAREANERWVAARRVANPSGCPACGVTFTPHALQSGVCQGCGERMLGTPPEALEHFQPNQ